MPCCITTEAHRTVFSVANKQYRDIFVKILFIWRILLTISKKGL
jgi:hypothetical protein